MNTLIQESAVPDIGIFWYYNGEIYSIVNPYNDIENIQFGGYNDINYTHFKVWNIMQQSFPELKTKTYRDIPRGRIVQNIQTKRFVVWTSKEICNNANIQSKILKEFNLKKDNTDFVIHSDY